MAQDRAIPHSHSRASGALDRTVDGVWRLRVDCRPMEWSAGTSSQAAGDTAVTDMPLPATGTARSGGRDSWGDAGVAYPLARQTQPRSGAAPKENVFGRRVHAPTLHPSTLSQAPTTCRTAKASDRWLASAKGSFGRCIRLVGALATGLESSWQERYLRCEQSCLARLLRQVGGRGTCH